MTTAAGAGMYCALPPARARRWCGLPVAIAGGVAALAGAWQLLPASGSTDVVAAEIETDAVMRAPFDDYLPVRATVAPAVTAFLGAVSGRQVEKCWRRTARW